MVAGDRLMWEDTMRSTAIAASLPLICCIACGSPTDITTLVLSTPPDFSGLVTQVTLEEGNSPGGFVSQFDVWVSISPSSVANAGVVVGKSTPVFIRVQSGSLTSVMPDAIRAEDSVEIWHDKTVAYGAAQAPPGAPTYLATQVVILR
jgi:hypothetical protein